MHLHDYLHENGITQAAFGRLLSPPVSQGKVNHWLHGARRVSLSEALQIERLTQGAVTLHDLAQIAGPELRNPASSKRRRAVAKINAASQHPAPAASGNHAAAAGQGV